MQPSSEAAERVFSLLENYFKTGLHRNFIDVTTIIYKLPHPFFWSIIIFLGAQLVHFGSIIGNKCIIGQKMSIIGKALESLVLRLPI